MFFHGLDEIHRNRDLPALLHRETSESGRQPLNRACLRRIQFDKSFQICALRYADILDDSLSNRPIYLIIPTCNGYKVRSVLGLIAMPGHPRERRTKCAAKLPKHGYWDASFNDEFVENGFATFCGWWHANTSTPLKIMESLNSLEPIPMTKQPRIAIAATVKIQTNSICRIYKNSRAGVCRWIVALANIGIGGRATSERARNNKY